VPLVEARGSGFALLGWDVWWQMEFFVVDALDFETWWEAKMTVWERSSAKDVDLRLDWEGWTFGDAEEVDTIVAGEERVVTMGETAGRFFGIKTNHADQNVFRV
jgi:hypothetical protein